MELSNLEGGLILGFILIVSVPALLVIGLKREAENNSSRKGLRNPKIAIPVGIIFLFLSSVSGQPGLWNPAFLLVGIGFVWIGIVGVYKKYKDGVA
ncbi:MAG: hypothetical protein Q7J45_04550 [bacterium]|nr:hypothetical protein [bacterium]